MRISDWSSDVCSSDLLRLNASPTLWRFAGKDIVLTQTAKSHFLRSGYAIAWGEVPCATVFLVGNVGFANPRGHSLVLFLYWFVEICIQLMLIWTAPFLVPAVRRWPSRDAFVFGLAFLAAAMAARDRKSVVQGKGVYGRLRFVGRRIIKKT